MKASVISLIQKVILKYVAAVKTENFIHSVNIVTLKN
jgi:hypothetical protein